MNCTSGCPSNALSYKFSNPLKEDYKLNQFLTKKNAYTHSNISKTFKKIRKFDYYLLFLTLILGFSIDSLYGMGHFMAYGIGLIISYIILEYSKEYSKIPRFLLIGLFLSIFIWHGTVKYSIWNGIRLYDQGSYNLSISNLERVVNLYPKKIGRFHIMLSEMYLDSNKFEDALEHAIIAKKINPEHIAPKQLIEIIKLKRN